MTAGPEQMNSLLRDLIVSSSRMHPDDLPDRLRSAAEQAGGRDVELLVVDLAQLSLMPLLPSDHHNAMPVDGSPAGQAFRTRATVRLTVPGGIRLWVPVLDSAERVGVLGVTVDEAHQDDGPWVALASLAGELIVAKSTYGDGLALARRTSRTTLAAEMRWAALPPLTFTSDRVTITGILEPAYEIAGDTFDYAVNGDVVHLAILDAMGHGLEASRMANLAVASYRHSRRAGLSLPDTARAMDEVVQQAFDGTRFVTGQLATLRLDTGLLRLLNMGHPLPLLMRDRRVVGELDPEPGLPAGLGYKPATLLETRLEVGDMVLMHTDGVTEARRNPSELFGDERFVDLVDSLLDQHLLPEELLRCVINEIMSFQDFHARDDATLLLAARHST